MNKKPTERFFSIFEGAPVKELEPGETLVFEGESARYVYNTLEGMLMLFRSGSDGRRQVLAFIWPNNFVGLSALGNYRFSAKALIPSRVAYRKRVALQELFKRDATAEHEFVNMIFRVLEGLLDQVYFLGQRNSVERLAVFLSLLHSRDNQFGHLLEPQLHNHAAPLLNLPMTRTDIADFLGLKIETVSRGLRRLSEMELIKLQGTHAVELRDLEGLNRLAGVEDLAQM